MANRITKAEKEQYGIHPTAAGNWAGVCWQCGEIFTATDTAVTQLGVLTAIKVHEQEHHNVPT